MKKILFVYGTRPEAIKLAPLIRLFKEKKEFYSVAVCVTAQHRQMMDQVNQFFDIKPEYDLDVMKPGQDLFSITTSILEKIAFVLDDFSPDLIVVQGDTTTVFATALAAFYKKIAVVHIEAGLRTTDRYSPFPEEINRRMTTVLSDYHFAPTIESKNNLCIENVKDNVYMVGNTVIDALMLAIKKIKTSDDAGYRQYFSYLDFSKKIILVTGHRRENFGKPLEEICYALKEIAIENDVEIIYPVHLNPNVQTPVNSILTGVKNIHLVPPLSYPHMVWLLCKCYIVLTDSGGIQEEAPSLRKPVLVMREVTERMEGILAGVSKLVGLNREKIVSEVKTLIDNEYEYDKMATGINPYGDGTASEKIEQIIREI